MIYLGADHGGYLLKEKCKQWLTHQGYQWEDVGNTVMDGDDDYPFFAFLVAKKVTRDQKKGLSSRGIVFCRSGSGAAIAANKVAGIRAIAAFDRQTAIKSREHNDANVLTIGSDYIHEKEFFQIVADWLTAPFSQEKRHGRRLAEIERLENKTGEVIPGILEQTTAGLTEKLERLRGVCSSVHIDVADGVLVPNTTSFDPSVFLTIKTPFIAHLMVKHPLDYLPWKTFGFRQLIAHAEAEHVEEFLEKVKKEHIVAGLAIDLPTDIEKIFPLVPKADFVLVMAIKAGFSGQPFEMQALKKILCLREKFPSLPIGVDGGMNDMTASLVRMAGADVVVATSFLFKSKNIKEAMDQLNHA